MAFTVTARHSGNSGTTSAQTLTTDSQTPTASSLLLVFFGAQNDSHSQAQVFQTPTDSGAGLTYTSIVNITDIPWEGSASFALGQAAYRATVGSSPSAFTITVDEYAAANVGNYACVCADVTGYDTGTPIVQSKANGATVNPRSDTQAGTVTLDATPTAGNLIVVGFNSGLNTGGGFASPTAGGGKTFTQLFNQNATWAQGGLWYRVADGGESATITCSDVGDQVGVWTAIGVEIKSAGGGGGGPTTGGWPRVHRAQHQYSLV